jgi:hypothetical protein
MDEYLRGLARESTPRERDQWRRRIAAAIAYARGDAQAYAQQMGAGDGAIDKCIAAITSGRIEEAQSIRSGISAKAKELDLVMYVAAADAGKKEIADSALKSAVGELRRGSKTERRIAQWLGGEKPCTPAEAAAMLELPQTKRIALAALAGRFPGDRAAYLAAARQFNQDRHFPYLLILKLIETGAK